MKHFLILWFSATLFVACESDTELTEKVSFKQEPSVILTGGGRWFEPIDTGTYYDADINFIIDNPKSESLRLCYTITFGIDNNGSLDTMSLISKSGFEFRSDTMIITGHAQLSVDHYYFIGLGRKKNDWSKPYCYRICVTNLEDNTVIEKYKILDITDLDRFHGVHFSGLSHPE